MRDHFVPRFHIRQFCNTNGRVFCFDKRSRSIPDRTFGNAPRDILYGNSLYTDQFGNLDEELYKPIERTFAPHLVRLAKDPTSAAREAGFGRAIIDWIAAQYSRTALLPDTVDDILRKLEPAALVDQTALAVLHNQKRIEEYEFMIKVMTAPRWKWRMWRSSGERRFVLGDHPVCNTYTNMDMGFMLFIPITPTLMLCGGSQEGHEVVRQREILRGINGLIASWCTRFVYSACLQELDSLVDMMRAQGDPEHDEWIRYAQHPHHGTALRIRESDAPPGDHRHALLDEFL